MTRPKYQRIHRSGLEDKFKAIVTSKGLEATYEPDTIPFIAPAQKRRYTPDWKIGKNTYIETKGLWTGADRKKMLWVIEQHPDIKIYMLFQRNNRLTKASETTYGSWCDKHEIEWAVFSDTETWIKWLKPISTKRK